MGPAGRSTMKAPGLDTVSGCVDRISGRLCFETWVSGFQEGASASLQTTPHEAQQSRDPDSDEDDVGLQPQELGELAVALWQLDSVRAEQHELSDCDAVERHAHGDWSTNESNAPVSTSRLTMGWCVAIHLIYE